MTDTATPLPSQTNDPTWTAEDRQQRIADQRSVIGSMLPALNSEISKLDDLENVQSEWIGLDRLLEIARWLV